jgi:Domain of unknown function (DUF4214)/Protein of unknown function (DUF1565)
MFAAWSSRRVKQMTKPAPTVRRRAPNLALESLEDRLLLNNRFVTPKAPDGVQNFSSLQAALTAPGLSAGDVIQIEPGSSPGHVHNADIPTLANLTIRGDASSDLQSIPGFSFDDTIYMGTARPSFTFKNVQMNVVGGPLMFTANDSVIGCQINNSYVGDAIQITGTSSFVMSGSIVANTNSANTLHSLVKVQPADGSHNRFTDNRFTTISFANIDLLNYQGGFNCTDVVSHNSFTGDTVLFPLMVVNGTLGLTVQSNSFTEFSPNASALLIQEDINGSIIDNDITVANAGPNSAGISFQSDSQADYINETIADNRIETGGDGSGIFIKSAAVHIVLRAKIQGNDLQNNAVGVNIYTVAGQPATAIDLGGGNLGSMGGNDFRDNRFAIITSSPQSEGPITAEMNLFGIADPTPYIHDHNSDATLASVDPTGALTGNASFVETLYLDFLHRPGDTNNPGDAGQWVKFMSQGMPAATVANQLARSGEALGYQVNTAFHQFLGREADSSGQTYFVSYLQGGGTLEGVAQALLASSEYQARFPTDASFVQALYQTLLQRTGASAEVSQVLPQLPQIGRAGVAKEFLMSQEYRGLAVADDYTNLLKRDQPPTASEVSFWVGSGKDLLTLDTIFAGTQEFQQNG